MSNSEKDILSCRVIGNGHPVIFLHGFLEASTMWNELQFKEEFQMIYIDLPGHGKSRDALKEETMFSMATSVLEVINRLGIPSYDLVGHSMGGYVGLELKKMDEKKCKRLVLLNSNFWEDSPMKLEQRKRVAKVVKKNKNLFLYEAIPNLFFNPNNHDAFVKELIHDAKKMSSENISIVSLAMGKRLSNEAVLASFPNEVMIIQGVEDATVKMSEMDKGIEGLGIEYKTMKGVGHMAHVERPGDTVRLIEKFIQKKNGN